MTLSADTTAAHVIDSNATTSVTLTPAANSLLVAFVAADAGTGNTGEQLTVAATGLTWNLGIRANGTTDGSGNGATTELWWAQQPSSASRTINVTDNLGSVAKAVKVVVFTDSSGGIPVFGDTDVNGASPTNLNPVSGDTGSWAWAFGLSDADFTTVAGHTLQDAVNLADGFDGGDTDAVYSLTALATGPGQSMAITKSRATFHFIAVSIDPPASTPNIGGQSTSRHPGRGPSNARFYQSPRSTDQASTIQADAGTAEIDQHAVTSATGAKGGIGLGRSSARAVTSCIGIKGGIGSGTVSARATTANSTAKGAIGTAAVVQRSSTTAAKTSVVIGTGLTNQRSTTSSVTIKGGAGTGRPSARATTSTAGRHQALATALTATRATTQVTAAHGATGAGRAVAHATTSVIGAQVAAFVPALVGIDGTATGGSLDSIALGSSTDGTVTATGDLDNRATTGTTDGMTTAAGYL